MSKRSASYPFKALAREWDIDYADMLHMADFVQQRHRTAHQELAVKTLAYRVGPDPFALLIKEVIDQLRLQRMLPAYD